MSLCIALFFLVAGTGYNAIHYCCDACRQAGIEQVQGESCAAIHQHHDQDCCHHEEDHSCCHHHEHDGCTDHAANDHCWFRHLQLSDYGIAPSLHIPQVEQHLLLFAYVPSIKALDMLPTLHHHIVFFSDSSPHDLSGPGLLKRVCRWIC